MTQIISRSDRITTKSQQKEYYSTFMNNFDLNPITGFLIKLTNEEAVKQSIKNLILTNLGERYYQPDVGSSIFASLFEMDDQITEHGMISAIEVCLRNNEPRVTNVQTQIHPDPINNTYEVKVFFEIIKIPGKIFQAPVTIRIR